MKDTRNETFKRFVIQAWCLKCGYQPGFISPEKYVHFGYLVYDRLNNYAIGNRNHAIRYETLSEAHQILVNWKHGDWDGTIETILLCQCGCGKEITYAGNGRPPQFLSNAHRQRAFRQRRRKCGI